MHKQTRIEFIFQNCEGTKIKGSYRRDEKEKLCFQEVNVLLMRDAWLSDLKLPGVKDVTTQRRFPHFNFNFVKVMLL